MGTKLICVILAAGKGTRMKSDRAKVLHMLAGKPMIHYVMEAVAGLGASETVVVVGHQHEAVMAALAGYRASFVLQKEQQGTAHAVLCAKGHLSGDKTTVLILCGDTPLIKQKTLQKMLASHREKSPALTVMTTRLSNPAGYGRVICDQGGNFIKIVEEKDASDEEKGRDTVNAGIYCVESSFLLKALQMVKKDNAQNEMYLTDIVEIANRLDQEVQTYPAADPLEVLGVNSGSELKLAEKALAERQMSG